MTNLTLRYTALTDVGLRRSTNQDSGYASDRLLVVADGMGGAAAGDLASAEAMGVLRHLDGEFDEPNALTALEQSVKQANQRLASLIDSDPSVEGMGTTVEAMLFDGEKFAVAHIGDSRSYRLRDGKLTQLSTDHTFVQSLVDEGKLSPGEARDHPHRSLLLRALLGRDDNAADLSWLQPQAGDRYLLCSDGLTDMVEDAVIERVLGEGTIEEAATELVRLALEGGGVDNVTVVIGEMAEAGDKPTEDTLVRAPLIVGSAADPPRRRHGRRGGGHGPQKSPRPPDPEEVRYAPRAPRRLLGLGFLLASLIVLGALVAAGWLGYRWTQTQYFVADHEGKVTIFRGVDADLPGISLNHVDEVSTVDLSDLPAYQRDQVRGGIDATSHRNAVEIVDQLAAEVRESKPEPTESPSPSPTKATESSRAALGAP